MNGFFSTEESYSFKAALCHKCQLHKKCLSPQMQPSGKGKILVVAEAPGATEDAKGTQLIGEAGSLLEKALYKTCKIDLHNDCIKTNAINCRPPNNRTPTNSEIKYCQPMLLRTIREKQPHIILLLGKTALTSFMLDKWKKNLGGINKWRGFTIPDRKTQAWIIPTYHPSYMLRNQSKELYKVFCKDLLKIKSCLSLKLPQFVSEEDCIKILKGKDRIKYLIDLYKRKPRLIAFDYETTGIKPHRKGHEIYTLSIAESENKCVSFKYSNSLNKIFTLILKDRKIGKIASNMKFEHHWSSIILKTEVKNWVWDTMLAAHVLDNREGITGLKFQAYVNFGIADYDSHIEKYLESNRDKGDNSFNRIKEAPLEDLLLYNGMDSLLEYRLAKKQMKQFRKSNETN